MGSNGRRSFRVPPLLPDAWFERSSPLVHSYVLLRFFQRVGLLRDLGIRDGVRLQEVTVTRCEERISHKCLQELPHRHGKNNKTARWHEDSSTRVSQLIGISIRWVYKWVWRIPAWEIRHSWSLTGRNSIRPRIENTNRWGQSADELAAGTG